MTTDGMAVSDLHQVDHNGFYRTLDARENRSPMPAVWRNGIHEVHQILYWALERYRVMTW